jgi:hypothetical protein
MGLVIWVDQHVGRQIELPLKDEAALIAPFEVLDGSAA